MVLVALIMNTVPLITALLGYLLLNERLKIFEKISLVICFIGVTIMITGKEGDETHGSYPLYAIIALIMNPIFSTSVAITLRSMRELSVHVQGFY